MKVDSDCKLGDSDRSRVAWHARILVGLQSDLNLEIPVFRAVFAAGDIDETLT